jgi:hypothetical protein
MGKCRPVSNLFESAIYQICVMGNLDKSWSEYCGGMTIEHRSDPNRYSMTILTGQLADQSALVGVINSLHDLGCPIYSVECIQYKEAG